jgi:hypothetical protein
MLPMLASLPHHTPRSGGHFSTGWQAEASVRFNQGHQDNDRADSPIGEGICARSRRKDEYTR